MAKRKEAHGDHEGHLTAKNLGIVSAGALIGTTAFSCLVFSMLGKRMEIEKGQAKPEPVMTKPSDDLIGMSKENGAEKISPVQSISIFYKGVIGGGNNDEIPNRVLVYRVVFHKPPTEKDLDDVFAHAKGLSIVDAEKDGLVSPKVVENSRFDETRILKKDDLFLNSAKKWKNWRPKMEELENAELQPRTAYVQIFCVSSLKKD